MTDRDREAASEVFSYMHAKNYEAKWAADGVAAIFARRYQEGRREGIEEAAAIFETRAEAWRELVADYVARLNPPADHLATARDEIQHASMAATVIRSLLGPTEERGDADNAR